jgi:BirA family biotin operon repressor/biotin-[acetyl-CoA-carboxylase] ligase
MENASWGHLVRENPPLFHLSEVDSTQNWLKEKARTALDPGTAVFSDLQISGRGRPGNKWLHLPGNLAMSVWMPETPEGMTFPWTLLAAYSVLTVLEDRIGKSFGIKYPNDIYRTDSGMKVGGILVESHGGRGDLIGIGLNRKDPHVPDGGGITIPDRPLPPDPMTLPLLIQDRMMVCLSGDLSHGEIWRFLDDRLLWRGDWVTWSEPGKNKMGKVLGLGERGHLRLLGTEGEGEVTLPVTVRSIRRITA